MSFSVETWIGLLGGALGLSVSLGGIVFNMLREESKSHADQINKKADADDLVRIESRWQGELNAVRDNGEKMVAKLEARHERDLEKLSERLTDQIRNMETNILSQLRLTLQVIENRRDQ